ncbi:hypothetical protein MCOR03_005911 [Pyricularia oryzae]|nr:hypothetical protein MCOR20_010598 [Pyricularia oryzae]KAI6439406.1 hypothetical protein MCOR22_007969 [Pyricularia oryzae]KAI6557284.1 hypothetical protein MCOR03_005911 [Pyricularia oryzae]KAI6560323.1 hypothetical protein MCOR09_008489 [Pyricularia oryzae]KAI6570817.1 hypothetical protein MCOR04_007982 [Pyricularia oryzae]
MAGQNSASPNIDDLTPEEASRIIHSHRKVRYGTACWPCRQRKVKCDNKQPCENCVKRDHAQLCSYKPNRSGTRGSITSENAPTGRKRPRSPEEEDAQRTPLDIKSESSTGVAAYGKRHQSPSADENSTGYLYGFHSAVTDDEGGDTSEGSRYLGQNSIPAILREQLPATEQQDESTHIRQDMRSILGLDTSAPFPLMSPRHMEKLTLDITTELPSDREVMRLFRTYKEIPQQFWGFVIDINDVESRLLVYLEDRAKNAKSNSKATKPVSASWLAILFAILAVGSQYHESPYHIRTANSQKYIQISFHFLRISNFLLRPNFDSIQALLMTSFALLNDMKAEASWALLGLTCRLAQSLGLDRTSTNNETEMASELSDRERVRRTLWWKCVWHDSLISLSFDRSPMTNAGSVRIPMQNPKAGGWGYLETMCHLCKIISQRLNPEALAAASYDTILENCEATERLREQVVPAIRSKEACSSALDRLQYFAIRLHTAFVVSVCCRPALHRGCDEGESKLTSSQKRSLAEKCKVNLAETVRMFLAMHQLSVIPTRSWAFTYHGLSSAVLLGILGETKADPEVRQLQGDLIAALSATASKEKSPTGPYIPPSDKDIELSGPLSRALTALRNIYDHGTIIGAGLRRELNSGYASGARTPHKPNGHSTAPTAPNAASAGNGTINDPQVILEGVSTTLDPHQGAAIAMTEMQNGNAAMPPSAEYPASSNSNSNMTYLPTLQDPLSTEPPLVDPSTYMSPMDVYDQIFWESPEPWNTGVDAMNFDFLAQPPPGQQQQQHFYF